MKRTKLGIIGCGMISSTYFAASKKFRNIEVTACHDIIPERAVAKGEEFGARAVSLDEMLADPEIEIVLNLTPPKEHSKVDLAVIGAGKHVYSEKPFGVDIDDALKVITLAEKKGVRVGCAPDTFLGGGLQTVRKILDDNWIGRPLSGTAIVQGRGPEKWGHAPFFYDYGAGPMLDLGPYYVTALVNLLGPAKSVTAMTGRGEAFRTYGAEVSEEYQAQYKPYDRYPVNVSTHQAGVIEFGNGVLITMVASFDVHHHGHAPIEIYGTDGSLQVPDPNTFGGPVRLFRKGFTQWQDVPLAYGCTGNGRSIGAADMARALENDRPHRADGKLAFHVLEVMLAFDRSQKEGRRIDIQSTCERPAPLPLGLEEGDIGD